MDISPPSPQVADLLNEAIPFLPTLISQILSLEWQAPELEFSNTRINKTELSERDPQSSVRHKQLNLPWSENGFTGYLTCQQGHAGKIVFQAKEGSALC